MTTTKPTVADLQPLLPVTLSVTLEDRLRGLVALLREQADRASRDADAAARNDHYREGIEGGKLMTYPRLLRCWRRCSTGRMSPDRLLLSAVRQR